MTQQTHPASWETDRLLRECESQRQRRSGPGGQHRNKVETAVTLTHRETQLQGQASERRSQEQNRRVALFRLRVNLALGFRSTMPAAGPSDTWQGRCRGGIISIRSSHEDFPTLLAEVLDRVHLDAGDLKLTSQFLGATASQLTKFLKLEPRAFQCLNHLREHNDLPRLR